MSQASDSQQQTGAVPEDPVKSSKTLVVLGWIALIVAVVAAMMIDWTESTTRSTTADNPLSEEAITERIAPVARIALVVVEEDREPQTGEQVYSVVCTSCHAAGVSGAPKFGDNDEWKPYIETGFEEMLHVAINGKGAMPARGGNPRLTDLELARAVVYMANAAGGDFPEPAEDGDEVAAGDETAASEETASADAEAPAAETETAAAETSDEPAKADAEKTEVAAADADDNIDLKVGARIYKRACFACHGTGVAGAIKMGDKAAWKPYIEKGMDEMMVVVINGKGAMPPRGGLNSATDEELRSALAYMVSKSQ